MLPEPTPNTQSQGLRRWPGIPFCSFSPYFPICPGNSFGSWASFYLHPLVLLFLPIVSPYMDPEKRAALWVTQGMERTLWAKMCGESQLNTTTSDNGSIGLPWRWQRAVSRGLESTHTAQAPTWAYTHHHIPSPQALPFSRQWLETSLFHNAIPVSPRGQLPDGVED